MNTALIQKAGITTAAIYAAAYALRSATTELKYFKASEFGVWWPLMNGDLLSKLDQFRDYLRKPVLISPAGGSIGRFEREESQHFPRPFVNAIDVMIPSASMIEIRQAARIIGFHGIGLYPHWKPHHGAHLDVRAGRTASNPAEWSAIKTASGKQKYEAIEKALA